MLTMDPRKRLFILLWLIALHSIAVALGLILLPTKYLDMFGFFGYSGRFFQMQSGVFHIVMSVAYLMAAYQLNGSSGLIYFSISAKSIATFFLMIVFIFDEQSWMVLASAAGDGTMALLLFLVYQSYQKQVVPPKLGSTS